MTERPENIQAFLGTNLDSANKMVKLLCLYGGSPEWLRGKPQFWDLPRVSRDHQPYHIPVLLRERDIALRIKWIVENLSHRWAFHAGGFQFEKDTDAVHYRLAFDD